ncbi:MAG TPA: metallophosphoesterase family protein [Candidatus Binatia bacterium]|nr:metallophosphoesterase family protein [Candidatus Binatia bacterium]
MSGTPTSGGADARVLCIGDVHGCAAELEVLLAAVDAGPADRIVFLGDYVDRGPASRQCIELLLDLRRRLRDTIFLRGNHEDMFLSFLGLDGDYGEVFLANGGAATLQSYGVDARGRRPPSSAEVLDRIPEEQLAFLTETTVLHHASGDYSFVHAGVRPGAPLDEQRREDLLWIRETFLSGDHGLPTTIVFGHTPYRDVLFDVPRKIGLDTGCVYGGRLSCLDLTHGVLHQVVRGARAASRRDVRGRLGGG